MDPIARVESLIGKAENLLGHSPHPAIVMLPLGAFSVSNICDALGLVTGKRRFDDAAQTSLAIGLVGAVAAVATGLRDYSSIPKERPSHAIATKHALGNAVAATLFTTSYVLRLRERDAGHRPSMGARILALAGGGLSLYTAWLGGVLVENLGEAVKPVMEAREAGEPIGGSDLDRDEDRGRQRLSSRAPLGPNDSGEHPR